MIVSVAKLEKNCYGSGFRVELAWLARMKSPTGGPYGMLLYEIKVLLGYLVCSVTDASNAVEFVGMYSKTREKLWEPTSKIAFINKLWQYLQLL